MQDDKSADNNKDADRYHFSVKKPNLNRVRGYSRPVLPPASKIVLVVFCLLFGLLGGWLGALGYDHSHANLTTGERQQYISDESQLISQIAKNVGQAVVSVDVTSQQTTQDFFWLLAAAYGAGFRHGLYYQQ